MLSLERVMIVETRLATATAFAVHALVLRRLLNVHHLLNEFGILLVQELARLVDVAED